MIDFIDDTIKSWRYAILGFRLMWRGMVWEDAFERAYQLVYWRNPPSRSTSKDHAN